MITLRAVLLLAVGLIGGWATPAPASGGAEAAGGRTRVKGWVSFEPRTISSTAPGACLTQPCLRSQTAWIVELHVSRGPNREAIYEVDRTFSVGKSERPDSVELLGWTLRPGARIGLEGLVERLDPQRFLLSDPSDLKYLPDDPGIQDQSYDDPLYSGWTCRGKVTDGFFLYTRVAHQGGGDGESYVLRVLAKMPGGEDPVIHTLALVNDAQMQADRGGIVYQGSGQDSAAVSLHIGRPGPLARDVPSALRILHDGGTRAAEFELTCTATRG